MPDARCPMPDLVRRASHSRTSSRTATGQEDTGEGGQGGDETETAHSRRLKLSPRHTHRPSPDARRLTSYAAPRALRPDARPQQAEKTPEKAGRAETRRRRHTRAVSSSLRAAPIAHRPSPDARHPTSYAAPRVLRPQARRQQAEKMPEKAGRAETRRRRRTRAVSSSLCAAPIAHRPTPDA